MKMNRKQLIEALAPAVAWVTPEGFDGQVAIRQLSISEADRWDDLWRKYNGSSKEQRKTALRDLAVYTVTMGLMAPVGDNDSDLGQAFESEQEVRGMMEDRLFPLFQSIGMHSGLLDAKTESEEKETGGNGDGSRSVSSGSDSPSPSE